MNARLGLTTVDQPLHVTMYLDRSAVNTKSALLARDSTLLMEHVWEPPNVTEVTPGLNSADNAKVYKGFVI